MEQFDSRYFHGEGKFFIGDRAADGTPQNLAFVGDMSSVEINPDVQREDVIEKVTGDSAVATSYNSSVRYTLAVAMRSVKPSHLKQALQGAETDITASSVTDERHTVQVGFFTGLKYLKTSNVVVTQDPDGTATAMVEGTDYKLYPNEGVLEVLSGGALNDGDIIGVDYDYAVQSRVEADPTNVAKYAYFTGVNKADGDRLVRCEIYKVRFSPGAVSPITDQRQDISLQGQVENDMTRAAGDRLFNWQQAE